MSTRTLIRLGLAAGLFLLFLAHVARLLPLGLVDALERATYDARVVLTLPNTVDQQVVVIDIDEKSLAAEGQWQSWTRDKFAQLVSNAFDKYQVRALGFDIVFAEPDTRGGMALLQRLAQHELADLPGYSERLAGLAPSLDYDGQFGAALKGKAVVLGMVFKQAGEADPTGSVGRLGPAVVDANTVKLLDIPFVEQTGYTGNLPVLQDQAASAGFFDNSQSLEVDGVFRRISLVQRYQGALYPALALELTRQALGAPPVQFEFDPPEARSAANLEALRIGAVRVPVDERVTAYVPYRGRTPSFDYISATEVIRGTADAARLRGKVALVGTTAAGLKDLRVTPVGQADPGVEVHANLVSGMLDGRVKHKAPYYDGIHAVLLLLIALTLAIGATRLSPLASGALTLGLIAGLIALAFGLWSGANFIIPLGTPVLFALVLFLLLSFYGFFIESRGKREISKLFGEYIPPELVEEMAANPQAVSMEGEKREMTVLFSDIRGFTTISEKLDSKELTDLMNQFLTPLTKVIQQHRGTIDKYMGDAIMAFWGAPLRDANHASNALKAGLAMIQAVRGLDAEFEKRGWPKLNIGVGLNTGEMVVGNMGSEFRRAYTVMGDAVNLGSRLEGLTKEYGVWMIVGEATRNAGPQDWAYRELDSVRVKGKNEPVAIYEPLGPKDQLDPALRNDLARHRGAMKLYRAQLWDQAEAEFFNLSQSGRPHRIYELFLERILFLRDNPPGPNWDGAFTFTHK
jgi:adenylate cyclase